MKTLDKYILREMAIPFLIGTLAVVLMFQVNMLIFEFKTFRISAVPAIAVAKLILLKTPNFLSMTLPVGMALASSLAMSRLARESELTAIRSIGVSILRVVVPVALLGFLVGIGNFFIVEKVMPESEKAWRKLQSELAVLAASPEFKSNLVVYLKNYAASFGTVSRGKGSELQLSGIMLIERPRPGEIWLTTSDLGTYKDGIWTMKNPYVRVLKGDQLMSASSRDDLVINEPINLQELFLPPQAEELSLQELAKAINEGKKQARDTTSQQIQYYVRFAVPAACFVFALTGPVFAVRLSRAGPFMGVLLSIILVFLYYNAYIISTQIFGPNGWLPPWLAAWLPNILFFLLGLIALRRSE